MAGRIAAAASARCLRAAALAAAAAGCADLRARPTFPVEAAGRPLIQEQALLGSAPGSVAVLQLLWADGLPPSLDLLVLEEAGGRARRLAAAPARAAEGVAALLLAGGAEPRPLLAEAARSAWPQAQELARAQGFRPAAPAPLEPWRRRIQVTGATGLPLLLLLATAAEGDAQLLLLAEEPGGQPGNQPGTGDEVEVCRLPLAGEPIPAVVWLEGSTAWMLAGSVRGGAEGEPLHRTVALRRGGVRRAEAELHNLHGLADYGAGELDAARREFERAIAADGRFVDALYNAASVASLSDRHEEAVALLRRAAAEDPRRVQVLGRRDEDLRPLRSRSDVRALLGLQQAPQRGAEAPPDPP